MGIIENLIHVQNHILFLNNKLLDGDVCTVLHCIDYSKNFQITIVMPGHSSILHW